MCLLPPGGITNSDNEARLVSQTDHFLAICPYASRVPFETWVLPREHRARFEQTPGRPCDGSWPNCYRMSCDVWRTL